MYSHLLKGQEKVNSKIKISVLALLLTVTNALPLTLSVCAAPNPSDKGAADPKATPPDGVYQCNDSTGKSTYDYGQLEIKGGTYRGLITQGDYQPYTTDASGLSFSGGFKSLEDGWKYVSGKYLGPDKAGKPTIKLTFKTADGKETSLNAVKQ